LMVTMVLAAGCVKEVDVFTPTEQTSGNINRFFEAVQSNPIVDRWDASQEHTIQLPGGSRVIVPASALKTMGGQTVSGNVEAKVLPIFNQKSNLLVNRLHTMAGDELIHCAGAIYIDISQNGQPLQLAVQKPMKVQLNSARYNSNMRLFKGAVREDSIIAWTLLDLPSHPINAVEIMDEESGAETPGFEFVTPQLGYLQCGFYAEKTEGEGDVCINLRRNNNIAFNEQNTIAFASMRNYPGIAPVPFTGEDNMPDLCQRSLPNHEPIDVIIIAEGEEGEYYFATQFVTTMENLTISIVPERATLSDIMLALEGL